ncbi:hypothetical protein MKW94_025957 [Papaver nudicaule]|uniref:LisH domain-containing protein n=1 Tax=Papaver nudicaule TaxID=74823 RepID=A0AA41S058_PAPNU|nr:hypothetical protein [Papaver nudicaule]
MEVETTMDDDTQEQQQTEPSPPPNLWDDENCLSLAQDLIDIIMESPTNPIPDALHALASLLENQESRYMEQHGQSSLSNNGPNGRVSQNIGKLGHLIRSNDEFFKLISSRFLSETRYSTSVQSAAARLLLSCSLTWTYPHVFEDNVIENIRNWAADDAARFSGDEYTGKSNSAGDKPTDSEMLRTYATGLLSVILAGGGQVVEDLLTIGLPAKFMRHLRLEVLGEINASQKDVRYLTETKSMACIRGREDGRARVRQVLDAFPLESRRIGDGGLDDQTVERGFNNMEVHEEGCWDDGRELMTSRKLADECAEAVCKYAVDEDIGEDRWNNWEFHDGLENCSERYRGRGRFRGKGRTCEGVVDHERALNLASPGYGIHLGQGRNSKDRNLLRNPDSKGEPDAMKHPSKADALMRKDNDDCFEVCKVGSRDITQLVKKATRAAEALATEANGSAEAVKCAVEAAADDVKISALKEFESTKDEEAAVLAASKMACAVVDAANATEVSRSSSNANEDLMSSRSRDSEKDAYFEGIFILDTNSLSQLRQKYCIQCLANLGEYLEVLGPVLHEKGVDVCLSLLQRSSKDREQSKTMVLLPDLLKLICALCAHGKFMAQFVDRGGMQKLLAVPRVAQTFSGLSSCLFSIGYSQVVMERVCALPSDVVNQVLELALQLLECPQDQAKKNSALFFSAAFVFRAILDCFDALDGLQKFLNVLHAATSIRAGGISGAMGSSSPGASQNDQSPTEVLTASEKQVAFHTCVALRQYFRAQLLLLVDSIRPNKNYRTDARDTLSIRSAYKPLDISNEAMDLVFHQIQHDQKLGSAFVKSCFPAVKRFLGSDGHLTLLKLCQAPLAERYMHELAQYALGVLHVVTLLPDGRKSIVNATLNNNCVGMAVLLDAANATGYVESEVIMPALNVLVNLLCPPPSIGNCMETRERQPESSISEQLVSPSFNSESRERLGEAHYSSETTYQQAREAVRVNNGIKVLLHLLRTRIVTPPASLDCVRALACRVVLGLARDETIAHILTKLQVGEMLSELIRESGNQTPGTEQARWRAELSQVAIELIAAVTNSGCASAIAATDAAAPTLRRIERAAIAASTPIAYHSRDLLLLIHEHLLASGLTKAADTLLQEAQLTPLPSSAERTPVLYQTSVQETSAIQFQWPSGRVPGGFSSAVLNTSQGDNSCRNFESISPISQKPLVISCHFNNSQTRSHASTAPSSANKKLEALKTSSSPLGVAETSPGLSSSASSISDLESQYKAPSILPIKRKLDSRDTSFENPGKRLSTRDHEFRSTTPDIARKSNSSVDVTPDSQQNQHGQLALDGIVSDSLRESTTTCHLADLPDNAERVTLDSLVVQYLKHQHRQCPAPISTLPPISLLHPHTCPKSRCSLDAPTNVVARLSTREFRNSFVGRSNRRDRQFVYSRFRPWRTCRDDSAPMTCLTFLEDFSQIAVGCYSGEVRIFDSDSSNMVRSYTSHQSAVTLVQSAVSSGARLVLSSGSEDVCLWDASLLLDGPLRSFEGCKGARFSSSGRTFAALSTQSTAREVLLYDIQTHNLQSKLCDTSTASSAPGRGHMQYPIHFSPSDKMLFWNGVLWDRQSSKIVKCFDQFTNYGGGGFHPGGNELIINSEVWDLRNFKLLRSVPSLDQTTITFNGCGNVIYAILRRNLEDTMSAVNVRRMRHPLYASFRTVDAINYSDIATVPVDRCILDLATETTDTYVGVTSMDDNGEMLTTAKLYEIGRRRTTNDDSDPDDCVESEEEDDDESDNLEVGENPTIGDDLDSDAESEGSGEYDSGDDDGGISPPVEFMETDGEDGGSQSAGSDSEDEWFGFT